MIRKAERPEKLQANQLLNESCVFIDRAADLGFILHGGTDNPWIPDDPGIFIKHVITGSLVDRKLRSGDRVLSVSQYDYLSHSDFKIWCYPGVFPSTDYI